MIKVFIAVIFTQLSIFTVLSQQPTPTDAKSVLKNIANKTVDSDAIQLKRRIAQIQKIQTEFIENVAEGKVQPLSELHTGLQQNAAKISKVEQDYEQFLNLKEGSDQRAQAAQVLQKLVDEVGPFLRHADHPLGVDNSVSLTDAQVAELAEVETAIKAIREKPTETDRRLSVVGLNQRSTLLFLPVPITVKAPTDTKVYFRSVAGGVFETGSSVIIKEADENGLINTAWISRGDGVADCRIEIIAEGVPEDEWMTIRVVQPLPIDIPSL